VRRRNQLFMAGRSFYDGGEDAGDGEVAGVESNLASADGGFVVGVAGGDHRERTALARRRALWA